ncbi:unnamed protein product, partial [Ectocarpus sp. 12 AP-2014]
PDQLRVVVAGEGGLGKVRPDPLAYCYYKNTLLFDARSEQTNGMFRPVDGIPPCEKHLSALVCAEHAATTVYLVQKFILYFINMMSSSFDRELRPERTGATYCRWLPPALRTAIIVVVVFFTRYLLM